MPRLRVPALKLACPSYTGTSLYNELLRSCLPPLSPENEDEDEEEDESGEGPVGVQSDRARGLRRPPLSYASHPPLAQGGGADASST